MLCSKLNLVSVISMAALSIGLDIRGIARPRGSLTDEDKTSSKNAMRTYKERVAATKAAIANEAYNNTVETRQVRRNRERLAAKGYTPK